MATVTITEITRLLLAAEKAEKLAAEAKDAMSRASGVITGDDCYELARLENLSSGAVRAAKLALDRRYHNPGCGCGYCDGDGVSYRQFFDIP